MDVYTFLDRLGWPKSYLGKILLVSFIGVHVPLIGAVAFLLTASDLALGDAAGVLGALLVATLIGTGATMACLYALLAPIREAASAIQGYLREKRVPLLPTQMSDEAGVLMANIQEGVTRLDAALDAANAKLQESEQDARGKFGLLSSLSHELRTPLNHIIGFAELMSTEALGPLGQKAYRGYANDIGSSGGQLLSVVQAVLDLSDAASAEGKLAPRPALLADVVKATAGLVHLQAQEAGVDMRLAVTAQATAHFEPRALKQILLHALQAAIEGAGRDARITVAGHAQAGAAVVEIAHDGAAWRAEDVPAELRAMLPGLAASGPADDGIRYASPQALRLSLVRTLLAAGDGALALRAGDGRGRVIRITLPAVGAVKLRQAA